MQSRYENIDKNQKKKSDVNSSDLFLPDNHFLTIHSIMPPTNKADERAKKRRRIVIDFLGINRTVHNAREEIKYMDTHWLTALSNATTLCTDTNKIIFSFCNPREDEWRRLHKEIAEARVQPYLLQEEDYLL